MLAEIENFKIVVYKPYLDFLNQTSNVPYVLNCFSTSEELIATTDIVISLGGDGTMLETLAFVRKSGIPVLGVKHRSIRFFSHCLQRRFCESFATTD